MVSNRGDSRNNIFSVAREITETKGKELRITTNNAEALSQNYPVPSIDSIEQKANKFIQRLKEKTTYFGEMVEFGELENAYPLAYAKNSSEFRALLKLLEDKRLVHSIVREGLLSGGVAAGGELFVRASLLADGWELSANLGNQNIASEQGFVAIWFDESMNESIAAIEEGIRDAGYQPVCIKDMYFPDRIMDKALAEIRKSRFIIVDLTENRGSVFFEAGFAHGLGIETIFVYKESENAQLEFYVKHYQCYKYSTWKELGGIVKNAISARIQK